VAPELEPNELPGPEDPNELPDEEPKELPDEEPNELPDEEPKELPEEEPKELPDEEPNALPDEEPYADPVLDPAAPAPIGPEDANPAADPRPGAIPVSGLPKNPFTVVLASPILISRQSGFPVIGSKYRCRRNRTLFVFSNCSSDPG
jgi:hypothetical protein